MRDRQRHDTILRKTGDPVNEGYTEMASYEDWSETFSDVTVRISHIGGRGGPFRPELPGRTWRRAAAIVSRLGVEGALAELDVRADRALDLGLLEGACRLRDLMVAIHAMSEDERFEGDTDH